MALPEAVVHTKSHDAGLEAHGRVNAAGGRAARRIAEVGIKIFDLRRPGAQDSVFEANAGGPAGPRDRRGSSAGAHLNIAEGAARGDVEQRAVEGVAHAPACSTEPAGLDCAARYGADPRSRTGTVPHPVAGKIALNAEDQAPVLQVEPDGAAEQTAGRFG